MPIIDAKLHAGDIQKVADSDHNILFIVEKVIIIG